jgi:hypothetical protein
MDVVYKARQVKLNRPVALKMILGGALAGPEDLSRFRREAEAVARLQHPNIVQIHEVGEWRRSEGDPALPFCCLEFCSGGRLADKLAGTPLAPREAATLAEVLARAVQAAHEAGIVHRDLNPANVLLTDEGTPKITDFGLAKRLDEVGQTQSGAIMGTPAYLAPEQALGRSKEIGPAADVYALGAILYEMLTGRTPFTGGDTLELLQQAVHDEPVPPRLLRPSCPRDLETICLKCLEKEPPRRYAGANALADDLRNFLDGKPVTARPTGPLGRAWRWGRRNPGLAVSGAVAVFLLVGPVRFDPRREVALTARPTDSGRWEARVWDVRTGEAAGPPLVHADFVWAAGFSPDGRLCATGCQDRTARLWDARTGQPVGEPLRHPAPVKEVTFSPDRTVLATATDAGTVHFWEADTGKPRGLLMRHEKTVAALAFSPDGDLLATGCRDGTAQLWEAATGLPLGPRLRHGGPLTAVAFGRDGRTVLTGSRDGTARLWPVPSPAGREGSATPWVEVLTGLTLERGGAPLALDAAAWRERRERLP